MSEEVEARMSKPVGQRRESAGPAPMNPSRRRLPSAPKRGGAVGQGRQGPLGSGGKFGYIATDLKREADERQEIRNKRTPKQQLDLLDQRLGKGVGAVKERARLAVQIKAQK